MAKVIFLALDGLSWNLINDLIANNKLDNFKKIINNGVSSTLVAEGFLSSPKVFCSIFTGKTVEKHGIRDFYSNEEDLTSDQIWDILKRNGYRIGLYRPLSVWSAKKFDGFCIPNPLLVDKSTYPKELAFIGEIDRKARAEKYSFSFKIMTFLDLIRFHFPIRPLINIIKRCLLLSFKEGLLERMHLLKEIELIIHTNLYLALLNKYELDFSVFFDYTFDTLSHIYWREKAEKTRYSKIIPKTYQIIDKFIGELNKYAQKNNFHLIICSDHGFESIDRKCRKNFSSINIICLLRELGYYYDVYGVYVAGKVIFRIKPNSNRKIDEFKKSIESIYCEKQQLFEVTSYTNKLMVKINGFIGERRNLKASLPNGKKVKINLILDFNPGHTGTHSAHNGVFIINGPKIKKGMIIEDITPYDVTPTIFALLNEKIPLDIDGQVLNKVFLKKVYN